MKRKINAKHQTEKPYLTESDIHMIDIVCDNIYTLGVSDGMNRAFEAMRKDFKLPEEGR